jgi:hypothetical protein
MRRLFLVALLSLLSLLCACGQKPFEAKAAPGFVELAGDAAAPYDFRAVAPEGVAFAVRAVPLERGQDHGDIGFWERAVLLRMRELEGYALLGTSAARTADGTEGKELSFGHDQDGKPFLYRVRLFVSGSRLLVIEAGGARPEMERLASSVDWMMGSVRFR